MAKKAETPKAETPKAETAKAKTAKAETAKELKLEVPSWLEGEMEEIAKAQEERFVSGMLAGSPSAITEHYDGVEVTTFELDEIGQMPESKPPKAETPKAETKQWVTDALKLKKLEGCKDTLNGTLYYGELK